MKDDKTVPKTSRDLTDEAWRQAEAVTAGRIPRFGYRHHAKARREGMNDALRDGQKTWVAAPNTARIKPIWKVTPKARRSAQRSSRCDEYHQSPPACCRPDI